MNSRTAHILLLVVLTALVWSPSLFNDFVWDDRILIVKNETVLSKFSITRAFKSDFWSTQDNHGHSNYYRPLVTLSYMLDYKLFGLNPLGFHFTNVILHVMVVVCIWWLLVSMGISSLISALCVGVWGVHPAIAENVAWISGRTDILATLFIVLSINFTVNAYNGRMLSRRDLALAAICFMGALLSKESSVITPFLVVLFLSYGGRYRLSLKQGILWFGVVGCIWLVGRYLVLHNLARVAAQPDVTGLVAALSLIHIWGNFIWLPVFRIEYGNTLTPGTLCFGAACGTIILGWCLFALLAGRGSKVSRLLYCSALVAFIPGALAVGIKGVVGARFLYTPGIFMISAMVLHYVQVKDYRQKVWLVAIIGVVFALFVPVRTALWSSDEKLFSAALAARDPSSRNHLNLGITLYNKGDLLGAFDHLSMDMEARGRSQQHYMLGLLYTAIKCETSAEHEFQKAISYGPSDYSAAHNLAGLYANQGKIAKAMTVLREVATRNPAARSQSAKHIRILNELKSNGERSPVDERWCKDRKSLEELSHDAATLSRIGGEHLKAKQLEIAEVVLKAALIVDPWMSVAQLQLAQTFILQNKPEKARELVEKVLLIHTEDERAQKLQSFLAGGADVLRD